MNAITLVLSRTLVFTALTASVAVAAVPAATSSENRTDSASESSASSAAPAEPNSLAAAGIALVRPVELPDPCTQREVAANATRPAWDFSASTTQCGIAESDFGFLSQPMGAGISQQQVLSSIRYGLTPRLDLRWAVGNHIWQGGGGAHALQGAGDQWIGARYRFHEQGKFSPAMALLYTGKLPSANPAKGLGSGFVDHQFLLIASRDFGKNHFDFNTAGTLAGASYGFEGATQFGLALTRPITSKLSGILESYGGGQPGTTSRFGAGFLGATYTLRPQLVLDGAFSRTYTAGSPRQQFLFGVTYASRPGFAPLPKSSAFARFLGR